VWHRANWHTYHGGDTSPQCRGKGPSLSFGGWGRELFRNYQLVHPRRQRKVGLVLQPATTRLSHAGYWSVEKGLCGPRLWGLEPVTGPGMEFRISHKLKEHFLLSFCSRGWELNPWFTIHINIKYFNNYTFSMYHVCIIEWIIIWWDEVMMYLNCHKNKVTYKQTF
jgi:hypothetical protein